MYICKRAPAVVPGYFYFCLSFIGATFFIINKLYQLTIENVNILGNTENGKDNVGYLLLTCATPILNGLSCSQIRQNHMDYKTKKGLHYAHVVNDAR